MRDKKRNEKRNNEERERDSNLSKAKERGEEKFSCPFKSFCEKVTRREDGVFVR